MLTRRAALLGLGSLGSLGTAACTKRSSESTPPPLPSSPSASPSALPSRSNGNAASTAGASADARATEIPPSHVRSEIEWDLGPRGKAAVVILPPAEATLGARYPLLIALHGRGESVKGSARGHWGWPRDYAMTRAGQRLAAPPLTSADYEGLVTPERLARVNARLRERPFRGLVVVCPYLPDFDWSRPPRATITDYAQFLIDELLPKARRELPVHAAAAATGIDGVSLGGCMALRVGFRFAEQFGAVGSLQGALNPSQVDELVAMAVAARKQNPALSLRVATSKDDAFVNSNRALGQALATAGVPRDFEDHMGHHDYQWNRGPGSFELLLFHDRALAE